jgi:hypothetical protein
MRPSKASGRVTPEGETARTPNSASAARIGRTAKTSEPASQTPRPLAVAHAPLKPPPRLAQSKPNAATPPDPVESGLERLGPWAILHRDALGKRAAARCSYRETIKEISVADGCIARCGCSATMPGAERFAAPASAFASGVSSAARFEARGRHRGRT